MTYNPQALSALKHNQRQLDMHGEEVGVSRQALEETLDEFERLQRWEANGLIPKPPLPPKPEWVEFESAYSNLPLRVRVSKVLALHSNTPNPTDKTPRTYIEYGPTASEDGTGTVVKGSLDEVQAKLDGQWIEDPNWNTDPDPCGDGSDYGITPIEEVNNGAS